MDLERATASKLKKYAQVLREARDRSASEADTVVVLTKLLEDVLGYDPLAGEITREQQIQGRYCDIALKLDGEIVLLIEVKQAGMKLGEKEIEQAENYASRSGIEWVALTNGHEWRLYHVTFADGEGITHELAFTVDLVTAFEGDQSDIRKAWDSFGLLSKRAISDGELDTFWAAKRALNPAAVVRALFTEESISTLRRELRRTARFMLTVEDVFDAVRDVLSKEALLAAGDIKLPRKKKRRRSKPSTDNAGSSTTPPASDVPTAQASIPSISDSAHHPSTSG